LTDANRLRLCNGRLPTVRCQRRPFLVLSTASALRIHAFCRSGKHSSATSSTVLRLSSTHLSPEEKVCTKYH